MAKDRKRAKKKYFNQEAAAAAAAPAKSSSMLGGILLSVLKGSSQPLDLPTAAAAKEKDNTNLYFLIIFAALTIGAAAFLYSKNS